MKQILLTFFHLSEGNYEEAIIAFTAAIEIDPKQAPAYVGRGDAYVLSGETEENLAAAQADYEQAIELDETLVAAYLGLADVYIQRGDYDKALEILNCGLENTENNEEITRKIYELNDLNPDYSRYITDNMISEEEFAIGGIPFYELSLEEAVPLLPASVNPTEIRELTMFDGTIEKTYDVYARINNHCSGAIIMIEQKISSAKLTAVRFADYYENTLIGVQTNIRNIKTGDSIEDVLIKIGVSPEGASALAQTRPSIYIDTDPSSDTQITTGEGTGSHDGVPTRGIGISTDSCYCTMSFIEDKLIHLSVFVK